MSCGINSRKAVLRLRSTGTRLPLRVSTVKRKPASPLSLPFLIVLVTRRGQSAESVFTKPAFFGAALRDYVTRPEIMKPGFPKSADLTIVDFDTGHWPQLEQPEQVNVALEAWIDSKLQ